MRKEPTFENAIAFAQDLVRIPSPSGGERDVADRVLREMEELGFQEVRADGLGNVIGTVRGRVPGPTIMLNCHMDVVAEGDADEWEYPPFDAVVADGHLHGRGAMDIKGPLALQTYAAAALGDAAIGDLVVAHTVYEERGGWGMELLLSSGEVRPHAVVIGEATHGDVTIGHRGRGEVEIVLRGVAGHASAPERASNALDLAGPVLAAIRELAERQPTDPVLGVSTLVATGIEVSPYSRNVIPDQAVIVVDWRVLPEQSNADLIRQLEEAIRRNTPELPSGTSVEVRMARERQRSYTGRSELRDLFTPGFLMEASDPLVGAAARAVGKRHGTGPATVRPWTFATDGGWSQGRFGIPTLGFAPGEERFAHTNRERLDLEEARWAFSRYPGLVLALQKALLDQDIGTG